MSGNGTANQTSTDPVVKQYREQISDNDLKILEALNKRIKLVQKLKAYKDSQGINFHDPAREGWILTYLLRSNQGPISEDGLREIFSVIIEVAKREAADQEA